MVAATASASARLKNGVNLAAVFHHFPCAYKSGRYDEAVAAPKFQPLALFAREHHAPGKQMAEFVLGVTHDPAAACCRPHACKELPRFFRIVVPHGQLRLAGQKAPGFCYRALCLDSGAKGYDAWRDWHGKLSIGVWE